MRAAAVLSLGLVVLGGALYLWLPEHGLEHLAQGSKGWIAEFAEVARRGRVAARDDRAETIYMRFWPVPESPEPWIGAFETVRGRDPTQLLLLPNQDFVISDLSDALRREHHRPPRHLAFGRLQPLDEHRSVLDLSVVEEAETTRIRAVRIHIGGIEAMAIEAELPHILNAPSDELAPLETVFFRAGGASAKIASATRWPDVEIEPRFERLKLRSPIDAEITDVEDSNVGYDTVRVKCTLNRGAADGVFPGLGFWLRDSTNALARDRRLALTVIAVEQSACTAEGWLPRTAKRGSPKSFVGLGFVSGR